MGEPLVKLLLQRGAFQAESTTVVSAIFIAYMISFPFSQISALLSKLFLAAKKTKKLLFISILSISLNFLFNYLLIVPFKTAGLALSTSLITIISFIILFVLTRKEFQIRIFEKSAFLKTVLLCSVVLIITMLLKTVMEQFIWLIFSNLLFLGLFAFLNYSIIKQIKRKIFSFKQKG
jgi:putative peptidoglycan lipid II flippase